MYDFCFTPLYAGFLAIFGVVAYVAKGSVPSLAGGVGSAALLSLFTSISFQHYKRRKSCKPAVFASLLVSAGLTVLMYMRFASSGKIFPSAITAFVSGLMSAYYVWNLLLFKPPPPKSH